MSGGHFDYQQYKIHDIASLIREIIDNNDLNENFHYSPKTIELLQDADYSLRKAYVYAQRIDWLVSGDDGEDSFHRRLVEELNDIEYPASVGNPIDDLDHSTWCSEFSYCKENQYEIIKIADEIERLIEFNDQEHECYQYSPKTIAQFAIAVDTMHTAFTYAKHVRWLVTYVMSEKRFIDNLTKALEANEN